MSDSRDEYSDPQLRSCPTGIAPDDYSKLLDFAMNDALAANCLSMWRTGKWSFDKAVLEIALRSIAVKQQAMADMTSMLSATSLMTFTVKP